MFHLRTTSLICLSGAAIAALGSLADPIVAQDTVIEPASGLRCEIITRDLGDAVEISGTVTSDHAATGQYTMNIEKTSGAGQSTVKQSGTFSVGAGRTKTLGQAQLGGTPGTYTVDLFLTVDGQQLRCLDADSDI